jgi:hypothetical protein
MASWLMRQELLRASLFNRHQVVALGVEGDGAVEGKSCVIVGNAPGVLALVTCR